MGIYQKDECRRAMMTARWHFPLHNNEPELIDYFVSPLGSANQSALPEWNSNEAERLRATCESRCRSLCMSQRTNNRIARRCPPASLPAKRQFFRMIAIPRLSRSAGLLSIFNSPGLEVERSRSIEGWERLFTRCRCEVQKSFLSKTKLAVIGFEN